MGLARSHRRTLQTIRAVTLGIVEEPPSWSQIKRLLVALGAQLTEKGSPYHFRVFLNGRIAMLGGPMSVSVPSKLEVRDVYDFLEITGNYNGI